MEAQNKLFQQSHNGLIAPFKNVFSYHQDENGNLVVQVRDFAEIASGIGGGIGSSYRQDTEIVYNEDGKMVQWQTSLGLMSSTPQGTIKQGYILEVSVEGTEKV